MNIIRREINYKRNSYTVKLFSGIILFCLLLLISADSQAASYKAGQTVAAKRTDGNWYPAVIRSKSGGGYGVLYANGTQGKVRREDLQSIPQSPRLRIGENVLAVWSSSRFYPGIVQELKDNGAVIKWDGGHAPSFVEYGKILQLK